MAITITDLNMTPYPMVPGKKAKGTAKIISDEKIESVKLHTPEYRVMTAYDDGTHGDEVAGDGVYTVEDTVPFDAPAGTYDFTIVATDVKGNVERKTVSVRIG